MHVHSKGVECLVVGQFVCLSATFWAVSTLVSTRNCIITVRHFVSVHFILEAWHAGKAGRNDDQLRLQALLLKLATYLPPNKD